MGSIMNPINSYLNIINFYNVNGFREVLFIILLVITFLLIFMTLIKLLKKLKYDLKKGKDAEDWPHINGTIIRSTVELMGGGEDATWFNIVKYKYDVNGKTYTSDRFSYLKNMGNGYKESCETFQKMYPEESHVQVYYNPDNPSDAVLSTEKNCLIILNNLISFLLNFVTISFLWIILLLFSGWVAATRSYPILFLYFIVLPVGLFIGIIKLKKQLSQK